MSSQDGVIKYHQHFTYKPPLPYAKLVALNGWRKILYLARLIGQTPTLYHGAGYGNVSQRLGPADLPLHQRRFIITGSQTGGLPDLTENHYTTVLEYYSDQNLVVAEGPISPSSEALTHGAVYDLDETIRFVFHAHSPHIWRCVKALDIPTTREAVAYGTPEMAAEVERLFRETPVREKLIFSMGGHEDGVVSFGRTSEEAGAVLLAYLARAFEEETA
jgi:ribulose-5-phosphate 4-epimerase/fuculose-1-phosphate aldolase